MKELDFASAVRHLQAGELVVFATETVFGLGADAGNDQAVAKIYAAKSRPRFNPLIVHVGSVAQAKKLAHWNDRADQLAAAFWPGPLTLVLPRQTGSGVSAIVSAGAPTIALRCPAPKQARDLASGLVHGIAAPSANKSGALSPTRADHVRTAFADQPDIGFLPGEVPSVGLESTVVDLSGPAPLLLRQGAVTQDQLARLIGPIGAHEAYLEDFGDEQVKSPGQLRRHYAPPVPLILDQPNAGPGQALLAFGPAPPTEALVFNLSPEGDVVAAAARLFEGLHVLGGSGAQAICAMPIPREGIGLAINDRLARGAVPVGG